MRRIEYPRFLGWLVGVLLFCTGLGYAGPPLAPAPDDRSRVEVRRPASGELDSYRRDPDFRYEQDYQPRPSLMGKLWEWIVRKINAFLTSESYDKFWKYVILAGVAGLVVYLLLRADLTGALFGRSASATPLAYQTVEENIHEIAFGDRIDEAITQRNYRLAVRLYYLQTLKHLTDRQVIHWQPDKTNRQYAIELASTPYRSDFDALTRQYEYAWYGEFPVSEEQFNRAREQFEAFFGERRPATR